MIKEIVVKVQLADKSYSVLISNSRVVYIVADGNANDSIDKHVAIDIINKVLPVILAAENQQ